MWYENLDRLMPVLMLGIMAALLRAAYEFSRPVAAEGKMTSGETPDDTGLERVASTTPSQPGGSGSDSPADLTPQQQAWADKAVRKYAAAQKKKWQRWTESMFEPK